MSRSGRLLQLVQALRRRRPVSAHQLAEDLGVSLRTIYRDVATLVAQGACIEGEAGVGYVLREGFFLPPLMFDADEADAVILGLRLVAERGDPGLQQAADNAMAKISAVLPDELEDAASHNGLLAGSMRVGEAAHMGIIRQAIRTERKLQLHYTDVKGVSTERTVWPVALAFFQSAEVLAAWCETRDAFRHFRLDRIATADLSGERYPRRRRILLAEWRILIETDL